MSTIQLFFVAFLFAFLFGVILMIVIPGLVRMARDCQSPGEFIGSVLYGASHPGQSPNVRVKLRDRRH